VGELDRHSPPTPGFLYPDPPLDQAQKITRNIRAHPGASIPGQVFLPTYIMGGMGLIEAAIP
jgi:hypothetical protein